MTFGSEREEFALSVRSDYVINSFVLPTTYTNLEYGLPSTHSMNSVYSPHLHRLSASPALLPPSQSVVNYLSSSVPFNNNRNLTTPTDLTLSTYPVRHLCFPNCHRHHRLYDMVDINKLGRVSPVDSGKQLVGNLGTLIHPYPHPSLRFRFDLPCVSPRTLPFLMLNLFKGSSLSNHG